MSECVMCVGEDPFTEPGAPLEDVLHAHIAWIYEEAVDYAKMHHLEGELAADAVRDIMPHVRGAIAEAEQRYAALVEAARVVVDAVEDVEAMWCDFCCTFYDEDLGLVHDGECPIEALRGALAALDRHALPQDRESYTDDQDRESYTTGDA